MMTDQDRIELAEAMGWTNIHERMMTPEKKGWYGYPYGASRAFELPDPFTDANDAYAVDQHMRSGCYRDKYMGALIRVVSERVDPDVKKYVFQIAKVQPWDWPRAALRVLREE